MAPEGLFPELPPVVPGALADEGALSGLGWLEVEGWLSGDGALSRVGSLAALGALAGDGWLAVEGSLAELGAEEDCATADVVPLQAIKAKIRNGAKTKRDESFMPKYRPLGANRYRKNP